jgi:hypothetical protein
MGELTERQITRLARLPHGHMVVGARKGSPLLERSDGRLATTKLVSRVQSYLRMERC